MTPAPRRKWQKPTVRTQEPSGGATLLMVTPLQCCDGTPVPNEEPPVPFCSDHGGTDPFC